MNKTERIRQLAEAIFENQSPREQKLGKITAALEEAYEAGRTDAK
jgi:hypothetical protein